MSINSRIIDDGYRNYVVTFYADTSGSAVIANPNTVVPPCRSFRLDRIVYDVGPGDFLEILWEATPNVPATRMTEANGQTIDFRPAGGLGNPMTFPGVTGGVVALSSIAGSPKAVSAMFYFRKKY